MTLRYGVYFYRFVSSLSDVGGAESIGRRPVGHRRDHRLYDRGVSAADKLLAVARVPDDDISRAQVPHSHQRGRVQGAHEADHQVSESRGLRELQMRDEKLVGRGRGIHENLR